MASTALISLATPYPLLLVSASLGEPMGKAIKRGKTTGTDLVFSPDDGGYYFEQFALLPGKTRTSIQIFESREAALRALKSGTVKWERWS
jgi:hypothetical protein